MGIDKSYSFVCIAHEWQVQVDISQVLFSGNTPSLEHLPAGSSTQVDAKTKRIFQYLILRVYRKIAPCVNVFVCWFCSKVKMQSIRYLTNFCQHPGFSLPVGNTAMNNSTPESTRKNITALVSQTSLPPSNGIMGKATMGITKKRWMRAEVT